MLYCIVLLDGVDHLLTVIPLSVTEEEELSVSTIVSELYVDEEDEKDEEEVDEVEEKEDEDEEEEDEDEDEEEEEKEEKAEKSTVEPGEICVCVSVMGWIMFNIGLCIVSV